MGSENKLTDAKLRTAKAVDREVFLADGGGLRFRILPASGRTPKGAKIAQYGFKLRAGDGWKNGVIVLGSIGEPFSDPDRNVRAFTLADARAARDAARVLVAQGMDPRESRRLAQREAKAEQARKLAELEALGNRRKVRSAFESWQKLRLARPDSTGRTARKDGGQAVAEHFERHILPTIGEVYLEDVRKRDHVVPILHKQVEAGTLRSANVSLSLLRQFFRWCAAQDWLEGDPTFGIAKADIGGKEASRERTLSFDEIAALPAALADAKLSERLRAALWLILATGVRVSELITAQRTHFNLKAGEWRIPETKNGTAHLVHLSNFAAEQIALLNAYAAKQGSPWILPARDPTEHVHEKAITKAVRDRQRPTQVKGRSKQSGKLVLAGGEWTPHDLRRTLATRMQDIGIEPYVIEKALNHATQGVAGVYQRAELLPERKAAFEAWGAKLAATIKGDEQPKVTHIATARRKRKTAA